MLRGCFLKGSDSVEFAAQPLSTEEELDGHLCQNPMVDRDPRYPRGPGLY